MGLTSANTEVALATIQTTTAGWNTLQVDQNTSVTSVKYYAPDGAYGNMAEIEVFTHHGVAFLV